MRAVIFCHSLVSDWNHGNAHFLRGIATELICQGIETILYEPRDNWSLSNLVEDQGKWGARNFASAYPLLSPNFYDTEWLNLDDMLEGADVVIVHEWNDPRVVAAIGTHRVQRGDYRLFFHDTHHRCVTKPEEILHFDLSGYDGVLAFGNVIRDVYLRKGLAKNAWTWHEAADARVFHPKPKSERKGDLVWIGNWGDDERTAELMEFLIGPAHELGLKTRIYGVRYPERALAALKKAGLEYGGYLPNFEAPTVFSQYLMTVHVPRRPYVRHLPGIPTIRMFEALACGIPLVSAPWNDSEHLFEPGDYLVARDGDEMKRHLQFLTTHPEEAGAMARRGLETVLKRHTCKHRVEQLLDIVRDLDRPQNVRAMAL